VAGRLAGGVAHDFNNVLTAVMASAELAQLSLEPGHAAEADLDGIGAAARRGAALTRRLLAFVRNDPAPAQRVDVADMLNELAPLLARLAGDSHPVVVRADDALGTVEVDRAELEHIVFNLVANARDAMPDGGPIEVRASATDVAEGAGDTGFTIQPSPGRHAVIMVSDGGIGMSDDVRRRMFDPFFTEKSGGRGTGLGLIGVRPLVERARGGLRVDSAPGTGTCVALLLPLTPPDAITRGPQPTDDARASLPIVNGARVRRILLVEDELAVREQLARLLNAMGHRTVAVASAADARGALAAPDASFDAVISDVMMPGESGIGFATWLHRAHPELPILMISGHTGESPAQHPQLNESTLLRKPFGSAELADRLATLFERSSARS